MRASHQFLVFAAIGAIGTSGHYAVLILLVQALRVEPVLATTLGFVVGALINYLLNYRITFKSNKKHREALIKFLAVAGIGAAVNAMLMSAGMHLFDVNYMVIQLLATCIVLVFNFMANKYWTFSDT